MKAVWTAGVFCLVLILAGSADSGGKKSPDKSKLVGVWEVTKSGSAPPGATIEFTTDGKLIMTAKVGEKTIKMEGTYKLNKNKLTATYEQKGKEINDTTTIQTLTDTTLVTIDEKGEQDEFRKKVK